MPLTTSVIYDIIAKTKFESTEISPTFLKFVKKIKNNIKLFDVISKNIIKLIFLCYI